jgi:hypothetical protein
LYDRGRVPSAAIVTELRRPATVHVKQTSVDPVPGDS